ncbi:MAG: c-type cytochrome, partial [Phycisphaerae bacterium]|nr:cytochrome c [Phycisphaerae bacterium]NIW99629.1 c-type cytochrome [Phycisphaerae bacterium]
HIDGGRPDSGDLSKIMRTHPDISPHRIDQLGCTGCHLGEGMALDLEISHGLPGLGAREVLSGKEMQASCFRCHIPGPLVGAEQAWKGYQRFYTSACNTCHKVGRAGTAGLYGPDLSDIGSSLGLGQLLEAIREPRKAPVNSKMPRFPLSKGQATQISYYLKSLTGTPYYATPMQLQAGTVKIADVDLVPDDMDLTEDIQL